MRADLAGLEQRVTTLLRAPVARWVGLGLGLVALAALVAGLLGDVEETTTALRAVGVVGPALALATMLLWHGSPIAVLRVFGSPAPARVWGAAQLLKYVPVPASAVVGFVGSSVRVGSSAGSSVGLLLRQTAALVAGAAVVGSVAAWRWSLGVGGGWSVVVVVGLVAVGLAGAVAAARDRAWRRAVAWSTGGWLLVAAGLGASLGGEHAVLVGTSVVAAWVAGQVVVPVPAGIGVREFAFVGLVTDEVGLRRALVLAVVVRVVHTVSDVVVAAAVSRRGGGATEGDAPPASG